MIGLFEWHAVEKEIRTILYKILSNCLVDWKVVY
jgi:hypothetical protein